MKKINFSVTGANGYIGSKLVNELKKNNNIINAFASNVKVYEEENINGCLFDIKDKNCWEEIILKSDVIFHLAGNTSLYFAKENKLENYDLTIKPIHDIISICQKYNKKPLIIFSSTATVYGLQNIFPVSELVLPKPMTIYDEHKLLAEKMLVDARNNKILNCCNVRLSNVYGPSNMKASSRDRGIINKVCIDAIKGKKVNIFGDGEYIRDYVYIDDVIDALIKIALSKNDIKDTYNICSGDGTSLVNAFNLIILKVKEIINKDCDIIYENWPNNAEVIEKRNFIGDNTRLKNDVNWQPKVQLEVGIEKMINFFNEEKS